jgi:hypothetical protein
VWRGTAALRDFRPAYVGAGSNPVIVVMSAIRPLFLRKQTFVPDLGMSRKCQQRSLALANPITSSAQYSPFSERDLWNNRERQG